LAAGVPILCSNVCGAADELVQSGVNGFSFAPGEVEGLANLMLLLSSDEEEWRRLSLGALRVAPKGDVARFADAVASVIQPRTRVQLFRPVPEAPDLAGARGAREAAAAERACALQVAGE
jgi:glycosyltransferase involved in cell wall biosynthesis